MPKSGVVDENFCLPADWSLTWNLQLARRTETQKAGGSSMENLESVPFGTVEKFCIEMSRHFESNPAFQLKIPG